MGLCLPKADIVSFFSLGQVFILLQVNVLLNVRAYWVVCKWIQLRR